MHIPDGFLGPGASGSLIVAAAALAGVAVGKVRQGMFARQKAAALKTPEGAEFGGPTVTKLTKHGQSLVFRMAVVGAFIFAAQMMNFSISGGTSGHMLGGVLAAVLLGPWAGFLVIAVILVVQSLVFADGGLFALGANIINMGLVGAVAGYYVYRFLFKKIKKEAWAAFFAAWISVILAALACCLELAVSGTISLSVSVPAMVGWHFLIGLGEGLITALVLVGLNFKEKTNE